MNALFDWGALIEVVTEGIIKFKKEGGDSGNL